MMPSGLSDKLYWRQVGVLSDARGRYHCFKRAASGPNHRARCVSLCGRHAIERSGGQACRRPEVILRCGECDGREMERRGWEESGPTLEPRLPKRLGFV